MGLARKCKSVASFGSEVVFWSAVCLSIYALVLIEAAKVSRNNGKISK